MSSADKKDQEASPPSSAGEDAAPSSKGPASTAPASEGPTSAAATSTAPAAAAAAESADGKPPVKIKRKRKKVDDHDSYAIRLTNVVKQFGQKRAVDGVSLKIPAGSVYGLIGPNGAGKTTTFSMMAGFLEPTSGALDVLGHAPTKVDALRARLGVLPQDALLPNEDRVGEFLMHCARLQDVPSDKAEDEVRKVLEEVSGRDWWNLRCSALSHGMSKRVAIAQAFLGSPEVVLLDEPTAGLDPRVAFEIRQIIKARKGQCTLIVSSHNLQELEEICDYAAVLDHGKLVASGSMEELTASSQEVRIKLAAGPVPLSEIKALPITSRLEWLEDSRELIVHFDRTTGADAETVITHVLWVLLNSKARVSEVSKGRGLEQRVMELTE
jgi:ABC-2 type transport system ATP-binding protein